MKRDSKVRFQDKNLREKLPFVITVSFIGLLNKICSNRRVYCKWEQIIDWYEIIHGSKF